MVLVHPAPPTRHRPPVRRPARTAPRAVPAPRPPSSAVGFVAESRAGVPGLRERGGARLWRSLDRVPAGFWRTTALYLAGRYLVLLAAAAVVLLDPGGARAELARWRGVGEVALLLTGRPAVAAALLTAVLGWVLVLLVRALLVRSAAARIAGRAPVVLAVSATTAVVGTSPATLLVPVGVLAVVLLLRSRVAVR